MNELGRTERADIAWLQDSVNRHEGGMSPAESADALPEQVEEIVHNLARLRNNRPPTTGTTLGYVVTSELDLPTPAELRRQLDQEGEK